MSDPTPVDPPDEADRPVPLVTVPEGTAEPAAWSTTGTEALDPPDGGDDEVLAARQDAERRGREADPQRAAPAGSTRESGYSTEDAQGAGAAST